jgi:hypothetical protein
MIHWKPEGRKKRGRPRRTLKDGIYTVINERDLRMESEGTVNVLVKGKPGEGSTKKISIKLDR